MEHFSLCLNSYRSHHRVAEIQPGSATNRLQSTDSQRLSVVLYGTDQRRQTRLTETIDPILQELVPGDDGQQWYVFRSRPRCEKKAAEHFADMGMRHYLPLREQVSRRKGRRFSSMLPLFSGYLFGCSDLGQRLSAMRGGHLSQWLEVIDQQTLLAELRNIHVATQHGTGVELYPQLRRGTWVRVVRGPLAGVRGRISRREKRYRIVLDLTALQSAMAVEVEMQDVEIDDLAVSSSH